VISINSILREEVKALSLKNFKLKLKELAASIVLGGSILYIYGQYDSLELDTITTQQFVFRTSAALIVLGLVAWFIDRHFVDGEWL
jgi:hypothetical protein